MFWRKFKRVMIWVLLGALVIASTVAFVKISKIEKALKGTSRSGLGS